MPSLNRYEKDICENCGTQNTKLNLARHWEKSCFAGNMYCTQCPYFSKKSLNDLSYHIARKHCAPKPDVAFQCKLCYQEFPGFYGLRQHRHTQHGMQIRSGTRDVDVEHIVWDVENHKLREELRSCQQFFVVENERARHKVLIHDIENRNTDFVDKKIDHFFKKLKCSAKVNLAFGFILRFLEDGGCR